MERLGPIQKKILLILIGTLALGGAGTPTRYFTILRDLKREWKRINSYHLKRSLQPLFREKLLVQKRLADGTIVLSLTKEGSRLARRRALFGEELAFARPKKWDKMWRIILFDIPEKDRKFRDILREHLHEAECYQLQKSVFVTPHPYEKQFRELIGLYRAEKYVSVVIAKNISSEDRLKKHFFRTNRTTRNT